MKNYIKYDCNRHFFIAKILTLTPKTAFIFALILSIGCLATGCGDSNTFTDTAKNYSISIPGTWEAETDVSDGEIVLSTGDDAISVIIQRFSKSGSEIESLDAFVGMYKTSAMPPYLVTPDTSEALSEIEGFKVSDAEIYNTDKDTLNSYLQGLTSSESSGTPPDSGSPEDSPAEPATPSAVTQPQTPAEPFLKTCIIYLESSDAFYVYTFTGSADAFDVNKNELIKSVSTIKESIAAEEKTS